MSMQVWEHANKTDERFTKQFKGAGGFEGTSVNPHYLLKKATELWGPAGSNWGWTIADEQYIEGAPLGTADNIVGRQVMHVVRVCLWYTHEGQRGEVIGTGTTPFVFQNKYGAQTDFEAPKKSVTDAVGNALSKLGFAADIFMGMFDNAEYRDQIRDEIALEEADNKVEEAARQHAEYLALKHALENGMRNATSLNALQQQYGLAVRKAQHRGDSVWQESLKKLFLELKNKGESNAMEKSA